MPATAHHAIRPLVAEFRRRRPLRAGSLIVTIFGDAIAPRGGRVLLGSLIRLAAPFGVTERLVRTSVARLVYDGWLVARRDGRLSEYALSPGGRLRFADATRRIYAANPVAWRGSWTLVLLPASPAGLRDGLRRPLQWLGFGQLAPSLLAHPTLTAAEARAELGRATGARQALVFRAENDDPRADRRMVQAGWDLAALAGGYRRFLRRFEGLGPSLAAGADPPDAFAVRTLLVHEFRRVHLRDPLLPATLLPEGWIGLSAYRLCRELYRAVFEAAEAHLGAIGERSDGPLPEPGPAIRRRFGGI
ncbi:MAG: phenylacetic acid degradation operon negative regulatory protein PaaX [Steroidobacteraceae bacterium]